jgi:tripartite ATP-independent transporter DctM subunit
MEERLSFVRYVLGISIDQISSLLNYAAGALILGVAGINTFEIISRRFFDSPTTWVFDVSLFIMVWFPFLGISAAFKEGAHIRADIVVSRFSEKTQGMLSVVTNFLSLVFVALLGYYGLQTLIRAYTMGIQSLGMLRYPKWVLYTVLPSTLLLCCFQLLNLMATQISHLRCKQLAAKPKWYDDPRFVVSIFVFFVGLGIYLFVVNQIAGFIFLLLWLLAGGVPVAFTLGLIGTIGIFFTHPGNALAILPLSAEKTLFNFLLVAVPLFIMGGVILNKGGSGERLYDFASKWIGSIPGGLAVATIASSAMFSAMIGTSVAVSATIGIVAIPALLSRGYSKNITYGTASAGGTLGILIPPSIGLIVYAAFTDTSVGRLFLAGFFPGIMLATMFSLYIVFYCMRSKEYTRVTATWKERYFALRGVIALLLAPVVVLGGIYTGIFTPTEAAAILVVYSLLVNARRISLANFISMLKESASYATVILLIIVGAMLMAHVVGYLRVTQMLADAIMASGIPTWMILVVFGMLFIVLGMFLEGMAITVLIIPILFPLFPVLGLDPYFFGVIYIIFVEIALLTPPVGLNCFMIKTISGDTLEAVFKSIVPFVIIMLLAIFILFAFPQIALWLPGTMK